MSKFELKTNRNKSNLENKYGEPNQLRRVEPTWKELYALWWCGDTFSVHAGAISSCVSQWILLVMGQPPKTALTLGIAIMRIAGVACHLLNSATPPTPPGQFSPLRTQLFSRINSIESKLPGENSVDCCERLAQAEGQKSQHTMEFDDLFLESARARRSVHQRLGHQLQPSAVLQPKVGDIAKYGWSLTLYAILCFILLLASYS